MNFKVGDRVHHATFGDGTIIGHHAGISNTVEFDRQNNNLHNGYWNGHGKTEKGGKNLHCFFVMDDDLASIPAELPVNRDWTLIVRPDKADPDKTTAVLKVDGKETRHESVKRYHKDTYDMQAAIRAIVAKIAPPVEPPKPELVKVEPIMMGNRELKVGSKFILKPYKDVEDHHCVPEPRWDYAFGKILVVNQLFPNAKPPYVGTVDGYSYSYDAIDRILEG